MSLSLFHMFFQLPCMLHIFSLFHSLFNEHWFHLSPFQILHVAVSMTPGPPEI